MSHVRGTGHAFRDAGFETARQFSQIVSGTNLVTEFPRVWPEHNIVEAFPNAFLGVLLSADCFDDMPRLRRGAKFDWLYDQAIKCGGIDRALKLIGHPGRKELLHHIETNRNHDQRAALICLLTAAGVALGRYSAFGNATDGYFFLPPWDAWDSWAKREIASQRNRVEGLDVWMDGERFAPGDRGFPRANEGTSCQAGPC
jgi:hypothetical protein